MVEAVVEVCLAVAVAGETMVRVVVVVQAEVAAVEGVAAKDEDINGRSY